MCGIRWDTVGFMDAPESPRDSTEQIAVRVPMSLLRQIEKLADDTSRASGTRPNRAQTILLLLREGLNGAVGESRAGSPSAISPTTATAKQRYGCRLLSELIDRHVLPAAQLDLDLDDDRVRGTYFGYLLRIASWLRTLERADQADDFQAIAAGARGSFEMAVDLALLRYDPECTVERMLKWEISARHKHAAKRIVQLERHLDDPRIAAVAASDRRYLDKRRTEVDQSRASWAKPGSKPRHPPRWTGRDLLADATRCDNLAGTEHAVHYVMRFDPLSWHTHGSTLAAFRGARQAELWNTLCQDLQDTRLHAREVAESALVLLDRWDARMTALFEEYDQECTKVCGA
jgi:phage baseplate assembly protein W